ncbi:uncharacterized protein LAESUDRAFT_814534 [Laetiporus sulphureus 93-53]|uniref:F-box domain-containing protein n=1 Tax=Laetiporus sulphureus 93-53 TaxID=1314785 RepID=A0A165CXG6_9APHY|nr:uncharacterized protein LAESUDRAFT_814534 [Laetiporus sulphureus 93-53]KZT03669.1 hypothetical protein LAESUDRAFT_814534 [Laetiporus sulphureus 93-53]
MNILNLNTDVLHVLMSYLPIRVAWRFYMTCHTARKIALQRCLSKVELRKGRDTRRFCDFVLADASSRIPHFRSLILGTFAFNFNSDSGIADDQDDYDDFYLYSPECRDSYLDDTVVASFTRVMRLAQLKAIKVRSYGPEVGRLWFPSIPRLADAIIAQQCLDVIEIEDPDTRVFDTLSQMKSRFRSIHLKFSSPSDGEDARRGPLEVNCGFLLPFVDSLTVLRLCEMFNPSPTLKMEGEWPALQELTLECMSVSLKAIATACPNLRSLCLIKCQITDPPLPRLPLLDRVSFSKVVSTSGSVRRVHIMNCEVPGPHDMEALETMDPVVLSCCFDAESLSLVAAKCRSLKFLEISLPFNLRKDMESWTPIGISRLKDLPLRALVHKVSVDDFGPLSADFAVKIAMSIPTLEYVGHEELLPFICNMNCDSHPWFRVVSRPEGAPPVLEKLDDAEIDVVRNMLPNIPRM